MNKTSKIALFSSVAALVVGSPILIGCLKAARASKRTTGFGSLPDAREDDKAALEFCAQGRAGARTFDPAA